MVTRAVRGLGSIVSSYSTLWVVVGASAWPIAILGHAEACGSCPEWLGMVRPLWHACVPRLRVYIHKFHRGENSLRGVSWREAGPLGVRRDRECGPRVG
jgi:hypothetical protein